MLKWHEMHMLGTATIENRSIQLNPRMRLKAIRFFPRPDAQIGVHATVPKHAAEGERLFQAACAEKEVRGGFSFKVRDSPRASQSICLTRRQIPRIPTGERLPKNRSTDPEPKQTHSQPRYEQPRRSFEHNSTLKSAQTAKPAPSLHHRLNPYPSKKSCTPQ
jgi:hypothetical protein